MELLILWAGFVGGWLLVAGPVFQASVELREEEIDRAVIAEAASHAGPPRRVSAWWWLLPPVAYLLIQRAQREFKEAAFTHLSEEQRTQFVSFMRKARGWLIVASGAYLIAVKETWELTEGSEWQEWVFWLLIVVMPTACLLYTVNSVLRGREMAAGGVRSGRRERPQRERQKPWT